MKITKLIAYAIKPRYVVMKGLSFNNRCIAYIGANATYKKDDYGNEVVRFTNTKNEYYKSNILKIIWTKRQLIKWRRLLGKRNCVIEKQFLKGFKRVQNENNQ